MHFPTNTVKYYFASCRGPSSAALEGDSASTGTAMATGFKTRKKAVGVLEDGVEIAGRSIAVGDEIAMLFGSAQRDPRRFDDPDRFDVGRGDTAHIGFGGGIHFCVGAPLARQELAVSLQGLCERFPDLRLVTEPTYHPTFVIRGLQELRLSIHG